MKTDGSERFNRFGRRWLKVSQSIKFSAPLVFGGKSSILWLSPGAALGGGGVFSTLPSVKLDLHILESWNLYTGLKAYIMFYKICKFKIKRIREALCRWECRKSCTLKELQPLIDTLHFACKVVPSGRPFLQRMIALTKGLVKVCTISFERPVNYLWATWHVFPPKYNAWMHFNNWIAAIYYCRSFWASWGKALF